MIALDFFNSPWPGLAAWIILYISDYYLTLHCARLYRSGVNQTIVFEGSYELTPYFQKDIDSLKILSPRFVFALLLSAFWLVGIWWIGGQSLSALYKCALGAMILIEATIHIRHVRNLFLFRAILRGKSVRGSIEYSRPVVLRLSFVELLAFAALFAMLFVFTRSWFVLGGVLACLSTSIKHFKLAKNCQSSFSTRSGGCDAQSREPNA